MSVQPRSFTEPLGDGFEGLTVTLTVYDLNWNVLATLTMAEVSPGIYRGVINTWDTTWSGTVMITEPTYGTLDSFDFVAGGDAPTASQIATVILTDATPSNQAQPGSLGSMVGVNNGIAVLGTVNDTTPSAGSFVISLATGTLPSDNRLIGLGLSFTGSLAPAKATITAYQLLTGTTARVWFANPFAVSPTNGAAFTIF